MPGGGNPFFAISETNQPPCSARVENTDLLSVGREYRLTVLSVGLRQQMNFRHVKTVVLLSMAQN